MGSPEKWGQVLHQKNGKNGVRSCMEKWGQVLHYHGKMGSGLVEKWGQVLHYDKTIATIPRWQDP